MLSTWFPYVLFAAVILVGVPVWCWLAPGEEPSNGISQEQESRPRADPGDVLAVAARRKAMKADRVTLSR